MSGLPRPRPDAAIGELTRRLAEEYVAVSLPEVARVVRAVAATATGGGDWAGSAEGIPALIEVIEQVARDELDGLVAAAEPVSLRATGSAPPADRLHAPHRAAG